MGKLRDRVILVTGGASRGGIGRAIAGQSLRRGGPG